MRKAQRNENREDKEKEKDPAEKATKAEEKVPAATGSDPKSPDNNASPTGRSRSPGRRKRVKKKGGGGLFGAWGASATSAVQAAADSADSAVRWMEEADAEKKAKAAAELVALEEMAVSDHGPLKIDARMCQITTATSALKALLAPPYNTDLASIRCRAAPEFVWMY